MSTATATELPRPGTRLPNGAVLVAAKQDRPGRPAIVLAITAAGGQPYVTWEMNPVSQECWWGHYTSRWDEALDDFAEREA